MEEDKIPDSDEAYRKMLEARNEEKYSDGVAELLGIVSKKIDSAIKDGVPECSIYINLWKGKSEQQIEATKRVVEILRRKGYDAGFCKYEKPIPLEPGESILDFKHSLHLRIDINFEPSLLFRIKMRMKQWFSGGDLK